MSFIELGTQTSWCISLLLFNLVYGGQVTNAKLKPFLANKKGKPDTILQLKHARRKTNIIKTLYIYICEEKYVTKTYM